MDDHSTEQSTVRFYECWAMVAWRHTVLMGLNVSVIFVEK